MKDKCPKSIIGVHWWREEVARNGPNAPIIAKHNVCRKCDKKICTYYRYAA